MDELATEVESLDKVPNGFRHLYEPSDGKFKLSEVHAPIADAVNGLNRSLKASREDNKKLKPVDLAPLSDFGQTPAEIRAAFDAKMRALEDTIAKTPDAKAAVEALRRDMTAAHEKAMTDSTNKLTAYKGQLYNQLVNNDALSAIAKHKGVSKLLLPFVQKQAMIVEESEGFTVAVVDAKGERRYSGINGSPMTIEDLVAEMKGQPDYARLFDSEAPQGNGFPPQGGQRVPQRPTGANLTSTEKIASGLAKNQMGGGPRR